MEKDTKTKEEPLKFLFDDKMVVRRSHQLQVLTFINLLSHVGLKTIEGSNWENMTEHAPIFSQLAGDDKDAKDRFMRAAYACQEIFSRWKEQESLGADYDSELFVEDLEDAVKILDDFQTKSERKKRGWE
jgi:hypothetical protein